MISVEQYFGIKPHTPEQAASAATLLEKVNSLLNNFTQSTGRKIFNDPDTGTKISGAKGGSGDGGFRLPDTLTGKPGSQHRQANAIDIYDIGNHLDFWITKTTLIKHGLYREAAPFTEGWCHLQQVSPKSGNRSFIP